MQFAESRNALICLSTVSLTVRYLFTVGSHAVASICSSSILGFKKIYGGDAVGHKLEVGTGEWRSLHPNSL